MLLRRKLALPEMLKLAQTDRDSPLGTNEVFLYPLQAYACVQ